MLSEKKKLEMFLEFKRLEKLAADAKKAADDAKASVIKKMIAVEISIEVDGETKTKTEKQFVVNGQKIAWITQAEDSKKLDEKLLQKEMPEIFKQFLKDVKGSERFYYDKKK